MANELALEEARREGGIPWVVERQLGPFTKSDFFQFGDVFIHFPDPDKRDRIVNSCGEDVQVHIDKYLKGYSVERMRKNKETGKAEIVLKEFPPNQYVATLALKYDLYLYSFVLRKFKKADGKRSDADRYQCRKWRYILSPTGQGSFEKEESMHGPELTPEEEAAMQREADAALEMAREARDAKYRAQEAEQNECPECNS